MTVKARLRRLDLATMAAPGYGTASAAWVLVASLRYGVVTLTVSVELKVIAKHRSVEMGASVIRAGASVGVFCTAEADVASHLGARVVGRLRTSVAATVVVEIASYRVAGPVRNVVRSLERAVMAILVVVQPEHSRIRRLARWARVLDWAADIVVSCAVVRRVAIANPESNLTRRTAAGIGAWIDNHFFACVVGQLAACEVVVARFEDQRLNGNRRILPPPPPIRSVGSRFDVRIGPAVVIQCCAATARVPLAVRCVDRRVISVAAIVVDSRGITAVRLASRVANRIRIRGLASECVAAAVSRPRINQGLLTLTKVAPRADVGIGQLTGRVLAAICINGGRGRERTRTALRYRAVDTGRAGHRDIGVRCNCNR